MDDLIQNSTAAPAFDQITEYIDPPVRTLWLDLNAFIQDTFHAAPKITYSVCSAKPGWNVKYQKSGKSICTLYPDKDCLVALVVIKVDLAALLQKAQPALHPQIHNRILTGKPFNHTLWLMIPVTDTCVLESLKDLLVQKQMFGSL